MCVAGANAAYFCNNIMGLDLVYTLTTKVTRRRRKHKIEDSRDWCCKQVTARRLNIGYIVMTSTYKILLLAEPRIHNI